MFSKWGFLFLLILAIFATGCRGLGSVIDDIPIPLVGSVIDNIVLVVKANRVAGVLDSEISIAYQSSADGSGAVSKSRIKATILDFSCNVMVDALQDGSVTWEDAKNEAASAFISSFIDELGTGVINSLWSIMNALENESNSDVIMASQICSRLE